MPNLASSSSELSRLLGLGRAATGPYYRLKAGPGHWHHPAGPIDLDSDWPGPGVPIQSGLARARRLRPGPGAGA